jgi:putative membrane protein
VAALQRDLPDPPKHLIALVLPKLGNGCRLVLARPTASHQRNAEPNAAMMDLPSRRSRRICNLMMATLPTTHMRPEVNAPIKIIPSAELRDYLAEERTFLAWIRTGLALMAFGFVSARLEIFPDETRGIPGVAGGEAHHPLVWIGVALLALGITVNLSSAWRYMRVVGQLKRGQIVERSVSKHGVVVTMCLALVGIAMTVYLSLVLAPEALHA